MTPWLKSIDITNFRSIRGSITIPLDASIVLVHGARRVSEIACGETAVARLREDEHMGELARDQLIHYPTVTREAFRNQGRITALLENGKLCADAGLPPLDAKQDRAMICGSPAMLADLRSLLDARGFHISPHTGEPGDYVVERAFVEK